MQINSAAIAFLLASGVVQCVAQCPLVNSTAGTRDQVCNGITFTVTVPSACPNSGCGVIIDTHGFTMTAAIQNRNTEMSSRGEEFGYVVIQGTANGLIPSWSSRDDDTVMDMLYGVRDSGLNIDTNKFHAMGFSQGGYMTWRLAQKYGDVFASMAPLSGDMTGAAPTVRLPILYVHGTADTIVSYSSATRTRDRVQSDWGLDSGVLIDSSDEHRRTRFTNAAGAMFEFLDFDYRAGLITGGHCFPGSNSGTSLFACPSNPADSAFVVGEEALKWFMAHTKNATLAAGQ